MSEMDIYPFYPGPNLSKGTRKAKVYPYLLRNLVINRPNQVWSIDISYMGAPTDFVYMTAIIDWYSMFIVGYTINNILQTEIVKRTVKEAKNRYGGPEIINSDQGSQFTSTKYIEFIKRLEMTRISMNEKGRATDNIGAYKWERLYLMCLETVTEVK